MLAVSSGQHVWALKSKAALLVALLIKRQGAPLWDAALPQLALLAQQGAPQAEAVQAPHRILPFLSSVRRNHSHGLRPPHAAGLRPLRLRLQWVLRQ